MTQGSRRVDRADGRKPAASRKAPSRAGRSGLRRSRCFAFWRRRGRAYADLRPPARSRGAPPMRFVRVTSADPACEPNCPEWLSAEGRIEPGSAPAFAEAVNRLGARRLPILIHSPGGSVTDAMAMGKLIRAKGLAVAVARTLMQNCSETAPRCPDGPGVGDHRRRDLRIRLRAGAGRRRRAAGRPGSVWSACIRSPRW